MADPADEPQPVSDAEPIEVTVDPQDVTIEPDEAQTETAPSESVATTATAAPEPVAPVDTGYTPGGVPTFESVREKIETRYGASIGAAELDAETPEGRLIAEQYDARQRAAAERLNQIRESMREPE